MKNKLFTLIISVLVFTFTANAQTTRTNHLLLAKKNKVNKVVPQSPSHVKIAKSILLNETFDSNALPTGWTTYVLGDDAGWQFVDGAAYHADDNVTNSCNDWLVTPAVTIPDNGFSIGFDQYDNYASYADSHQVLVMDGADPSTATLLDTLYEGIGTEDTWETKTFTLDQFNGQTIYIAFRYTGDYADQWTIDNVSVYKKEQNDLAITEVTPTFVMADEDAIFNVTVKNSGTNVQNDFTVNVVANNGTSDVFTSSLSVTGANLAANADSTYVISDIWSSVPAGSYTLNAYVVLAGDTESSNDTLTTTFKSVEFTYTEKGKLFGYNAYSPSAGLGDHIVDVNISDGSLTDIAMATTSNFLGCADYVDGVIAGVENSSNDVYFVASDGGTYKQGTISGVTSVTGLAYDDSTDVIYVSDYASSNSTLFTVNKETMVASSVGQIVAGLIIGIAGDGHGHLWGINMTDHSLYSIDPTTGAGTLIGDLGVSISYAQDIGYDRGSGVLYGTLYTDAGGLYTIDVNTGAATLVGTAFGDEVTMCAIVPTAPKYTVTFNVTDGTNPIDSANISVLSYNIMTDSTGMATIDLNSGTYNYTISKDGFGTINGSLTVADTAITVDVSMVGMSNPETVNFSVYPNPSNGNISISLDGEYNVSVMNSIGQLVVSKVISNFGTIDLNNQPAGIYFIAVKSNNNITTKRIVIE